MDELTLFKFNVDGLSIGGSGSSEDSLVESEPVESESPRRSRSIGRRLGQAIAVSIAMSVVASLIARRVGSRFGSEEMDEESAIDEDSEVVSVDTPVAEEQ